MHNFSPSETIALAAVVFSFLSATTVTLLTAFFSRKNLKLQLDAASRTELDRRLETELHKSLSDFNSITYEYITSIRDVRRDVGATPDERAFIKITEESIANKLEASSKLSRRLEARALDILLLTGPCDVTNAAANVSVALSDLYNFVVVMVGSRVKSWEGFELLWVEATKEHRKFQECARKIITKGTTKFLNP